jgi:hypothetical protein
VKIEVVFVGEFPDVPMGWDDSRMFGMNGMYVCMGADGYGLRTLELIGCRDLKISATGV